MLQINYTNKEAFGKALKNARIEHNITQIKLSKEALIPRTSISNYERMKSLPKRQTLELIIEAMYSHGMNTLEADTLRREWKKAAKVSSGKVIGKIIN